jgi:hypothetical protein
MRKLVITFLALGVFAASAAFAGNLLNEGFAYPVGPLVSPPLTSAPAGGGWWTYSGGGTTDIQVLGSGIVSGQMGMSSSGCDDQTSLIGQVIQPTSVSTYACFWVRIPCATISAAPIASYFAGLGATSAPTSMVARVYVLPITGGWTFGISNSSTGTASTAGGVTAWGTTPLACDTWYKIVIKYNPTGGAQLGVSTLWVDPVSEGSPSVSNTLANQNVLAVSSFFIRQGAASVFNPAGFLGTTFWKWEVKEAGVGTTFAEACYTAPVPANGTSWGQLKSIYR